MYFKNLVSPTENHGLRWTGLALRKLPRSTGPFYSDIEKLLVCDIAIFIFDLGNQYMPFAKGFWEQVKECKNDNNVFLNSFGKSQGKSVL